MTYTSQSNIPSHIEVVRERSNSLSLVDVLIDGVPFAYPILDENVQVTVGQDGKPSHITVSIECRRLTVDEVGAPTRPAARVGARSTSRSRPAPAAQAGLDDDQAGYGIVRDTTGEVRGRCADDCTLRVAGPGKMVCGENASACPSPAASGQ